MANWKLGKVQYGFVETATSGGTLTLTASSKQYQILTGTMNHNVKLPDATTIGVGVGVGFTISNQSTGIVTVQLNDNSTLMTLPAGQSTKLILTNAGTANGVWRTAAAGGGTGGIASVEPGATITSNYTVQATDDGRVLNVDTSSISVQITLPAPEAGFKITIKDFKGNSQNNPISIVRNGSELLDGENSDDQINTNFSAVSLVSDGTDWFRVSGFSGVAPAIAPRALFGGGNNGGALNTIDYVEIGTLGNAADFGDLSQARLQNYAVGSSTRAVFAGGQNGGAVNTIDYVNFSVLGNATDFGDMTVARNGGMAGGNNTRGLFAGGQAGVNTVIDYITIATTGNATSFGSLGTGRTNIGGCSMSSSTRALFCGSAGGPINTIEYVTIATTGNGTNFGNLTRPVTEQSTLSSPTRGVCVGGNQTDAGGGDVNTIDYVTIATTGNAVDFGDLSVAKSDHASTSSHVRGVIGGGQNNALTVLNTIEYITIATTGNSSNFGNLTQARHIFAATSNAHGGL